MSLRANIRELSKVMNKKYKIIAKAMISGQLAEAEMPDSLNVRTISVSELKKMVREEFEKAKSLEDLKVKEGQFADAELEKEIDWVKTLKLESFFLTESALNLSPQDLKVLSMLGSPLAQKLIKVKNLSSDEMKNLANELTDLDNSTSQGNPAALNLAYKLDNEIDSQEPTWNTGPGERDSIDAQRLAPVRKGK